MQETWRWFGPDDPVSLRNVAQAGATGVVTSLHHIPTGELWPLQELLDRRADIESHGMNWAVVESLPVHNDIKTRSANRRVGVLAGHHSVVDLSGAVIAVHFRRI